MDRGAFPASRGARRRRAPPPRGAALALALAALACARQPSLAPVGVIVVRTTELGQALAEAGIDARTTLDAARSGLEEAGLTVDEGARRSYRATVEVISFNSVAGPRGREAEVLLELRLEQSWAAGPVARQVGSGRAPLSGGGRLGAWREAERAAARMAAQGLALDLRARLKPTEGLVAELDGGDPRARERAVRALSARGARSAAVAVAKHVRDPDPAVAAAAVEALTALKDPGSALALIEAAQGGDAGTTLRLLPVLVEIGGPDVEGYLLTLGSGHADRNVRQAAAEALARLHPAVPPPATKR
jgi:hypothetical protein